MLVLSTTEMLVLSTTEMLVLSTIEMLVSGRSRAVWQTLQKGNCDGLACVKLSFLSEGPACVKLLFFLRVLRVLNYSSF